jgi:hypothetical protein
VVLEPALLDAAAENAYAKDRHLLPPVGTRAPKTSNRAGRDHGGERQASSTVHLVSS